MLPGEVYFLTFFSYSFLTYYGTQKYFLFNNGYPVGTPVYDHLFFCRSFTVYSTNQLVNGNTLTVAGLALRNITIKAKYVGGLIESDTFYTMAINVRLKVYNTDNYFCTYKRPTATIAMEDVTDSSITIRNLQLRECNEGSLFAEHLEVVRGVRDTNGGFTFLRSEKMYNVQLGTIGCDPSCLVCNGTSSSNCQVCANASYFLYNGACFSQCPPAAAAISSYSFVFQDLLMTQSLCMATCPFGFYAHPATSVCTACNPDCLTCNSSEIASCLSCNPVMQLYNGICIQNCPTPHNANNYTSYVCDVLSRPANLQVKIQSLGYVNSIPSD